ncbi:transcription termination/antitermination protein NusG [Castellaniella sp.]|uniref:transcription termination/antitermination protein NusG n=1 Tax=Castellaniella sp. TaxID=1955812 RepID=UPI0035657272
MSTLPTAWYVVHSKPRQERVALEQLERQAFEVYLPLFRVFARPTRGRGARAGDSGAGLGAGGPRTGDSRAGGSRAGSLRTRSQPLTTFEPMFPRYLFLRPTRATQSLAVVRSTVGVSRLVLFGHQPALLADAAVEAIRQAEAWRNMAPLDAISPYAPGMAVRLLDPAFAGLEALVQSVSRDRVTLLLEILGRPQHVQVAFAHIAPR